MRFFLYSLASFSFLVSPAAQADLAGPAVNRVQACVSCHGALGMGSDIAPALAGQDQHKLRNRLLAYKYSTGPESLMVEEARRLTDYDIDQLARFFSQPQQQVSTP